MDTASKILVVGGTLNLAFAFVMGFLWSRLRMKDPANDPKFLAVAHRMGLWGSFMLFGLVWAVALSPLAAGWEIAAAWLLVASSAFQDLGATTNWVRGVRDQFAERSLGLRFGTINSLLATAGLAILIVGVFRGL